MVSLGDFDAVDSGETAAYVTTSKMSRSEILGGAFNKASNTIDWTAAVSMHPMFKEVRDSAMKDATELGVVIGTTTAILKQILEGRAADDGCVYEDDCHKHFSEMSAFAKIYLDHIVPSFASLQSVKGDTGEEKISNGEAEDGTDVRKALGAAVGNIATQLRRGKLRSEFERIFSASDRASLLEVLDTFASQSRGGAMRVDDW